MNTSTFDHNFALESVSGDRELLRRMVEIFERQTGEIMADMNQAIARNDAPTLERSAHKLAGSAAMFGAAAVCERARELETRGRENDLTGANALHSGLGREIEKLRAELAEFCGGGLT